MSFLLIEISTKKALTLHEGREASGYRVRTLGPGLVEVHAGDESRAVRTGMAFRLAGRHLLLVPEGQSLSLFEGEGHFDPEHLLDLRRPAEAWREIQKRHLSSRWLGISLGAFAPLLALLAAIALLLPLTRSLSHEAEAPTRQRLGAPSEALVTWLDGEWQTWHEQGWSSPTPEAAAKMPTLPEPTPTPEPRKRVRRPVRPARDPDTAFFLPLPREKP